MRRKSFAIVAMLVITAALMSSVIPSGGINVAFADNDYSQNRSSDEDRHSEDESNFEEEKEEEEDDSTRSNEDDDNEDDSEDNIRSQDEDENSEDEENGDNGDSSETGTEQENEQKNVCSGWAVCVNIAANAQDTGAAGVARSASDIPFQLATPF
jgi:outer membrane murein-binding lipoprotein Lpp